MIPYSRFKEKLSEAKISRGYRSGGMPTGDERASDDKPLLKWLDKLEAELKKKRKTYQDVDAADAVKLYNRGVIPRQAAKDLLSGREIKEAETLHWDKMHKSEKEELLSGVRLPKSFANDTWRGLDRRAKEKLGKYISKTTEKEFRLDEEELTPAQKKKMEKIVLSMKKKEDEFKERYGDEWKSVMYATATKIAKESVNEARRGKPAPLPKATNFAIRMPIKDKKHDIELAKIVGVETDRKGLVQTGRKEGDSYVFYFKSARDRTKFRDKYLRNEGFASDAQRRAAFASGYKAKGKKHKKKMKEDMPNVNTGGVSGMTPGTVGVKRKKKKRGHEHDPRLFKEGLNERLEKSLRSINPNDRKFTKEYCGHPVFRVSEAEFNKCKTRRRKNERWNKFFEGDSQNGGAIKKYSQRNPRKPVVIQNELTGEMAILRRKMNDGRLKHNKKK